MTTVDVHTHVFNHAYIPVEGAVTQIMVQAHVPKFLARPVAKAFAALIAWLAQDAGDARRISDRIHDGIPLDEIIDDILAVHRRRGSRALDDGGHAHADDATEALFDKIQAALDADPDVPQAAAPDARDHRAYHEESLHEFLLRLEALVGIDDVRFILAMLNPVPDICLKLEAAYQVPQKGTSEIAHAVANDAPSLFVHHMMDMQLAYEVKRSGKPLKPAKMPAPPDLTYPEAIGGMVDVARREQGRFAGFVAFEPRREGALELVKDALVRGLVGVKLYPPMGYHPLDARYTDIFGDLYAYCETEQVPIMVHTSPMGFQAYGGFGLYADPEADGEGWRGVLEAFPNLRVCLGHAGAGHRKNYKKINPGPLATKVAYPGWFDSEQAWDDDPARCYAQKVIALVNDARFPHVYTDFSYFMGMLSSDKRRGNVKKHLLRIAGDPALAGFFDRLMYGSDWHMPEAIGLPDDLMEAFRSMFQTPELRGFAPSFFGKNALSFLNLKGSVTRVRKAWADGVVPEDNALKPALSYWEKLVG